ncbi:MAG: hypothetical protein JKY28_05455 [Sulfurimonas sp.]|nr:hypothetical protein [Sulfurimonas sp.]PHQ88367.1 MAG: hypothetical protein COB42_08985 [Sulfurimonas sp.]
MIQKYKQKFLIGFIALLVMSIYIFITTWQSSTYKEVHNMYPLEKSANKEASEEFLKAMEYRIYIKQLHPFFDYDSFIMSPLLEKLDYHFKKGKALLPKESVEDVVWWVLFYKEIHGLLVPPRNDNSLAYENLPYKEFKKVHDEVYEMIMRYSDGEVHFKIDEIKSFRFKAMAILVGFYYKEFSNRYSGNTGGEKQDNANRDIEALELLSNIKDSYSMIYTKYIGASKDREAMQRSFLADSIYINADLIAKYTFINNTQVLPSRICYSEGVQFILHNIDELISYVGNHYNHQAKIINTLLFDVEESNKYTVLQILKYRCPNLQPEINHIVSRVEKLNKSRK